MTDDERALLVDLVKADVSRLHDLLDAGALPADVVDRLVRVRRRLLVKLLDGWENWSGTI